VSITNEAYGEIIMLKNGWCIWITGLPGSGKSTVANELIELLRKENVKVQLLSSDGLRKIMTPKATYSLEERDSVYDTGLLTRNHVNVVIDSTGNLRRYRDEARNMISEFFEVYLQCPLEKCRQRESTRKLRFDAPKQIYQRAKRGVATTVPGVGQPYEPPLKPELTLDTSMCTPAECARNIFRLLQFGDSEK
jgi:adenylylsulfate kinase